ncbi:MAG TPA: sugar ABC transporter ATP-binding protein [Solirubrobacteraceae bacterium]|nr:sugar ABC transporter ATP-binding protein [Solirubrobacteraceae bacterium]
MAAEGATADVLQVSGVVKAFGGLRALQGVSLRLAPGEVLGLVGANGAGKSTLVKILAGLLRPDAGNITVAGETMAALTPSESRAAGISVIHQELALIDSQSVAENIFLGHPRPRRWGAIDWRRLTAEAERACTETGIALDVRRPVGELSTWQRWATVLVRELRVRSRVLILDEPTAAMDEAHVERVFAAVRGARAAGASCIFVSHRLGEVMELCDRAQVLRDGVAVGELDAGEMSKPRLMELIVGDHAAVPSRVAPSSAPAAPVRGASRGGPGADEAMLTVSDLRQRPTSVPTSFAVRPGEIVGLAGLVGSGRSRMLRILAGAQRPAAGRIAFAGRELRPGSVGRARRAGVVFIGEDRLAEGLVDTLSVATNISLGRPGGGWPRGTLVSADREAAIAAGWIETLRIRGASPNGSVMELSGGNQQKLLFARALECRPQLLLLDEPTRGVDVGSREQLYSIVSDFARAGGAVITAMSDLDELAGLVSSALVLREGSVVDSLPAGSVSRSAILEACYGHR